MHRVLVLFFILSVTHLLHADTLMLTFEGLADSTAVTTQYSGMVFTNATALTAGVSLNEIEFPPHSGTNVVFDNGGPMSIAFSIDVFGFAGYFNYAEPLTLRAYDASDKLLATVTSAFSSNLGTSGASASSTNEFLQVTSEAAIAEIVMTADPAGSSFTLDDATLTVPEPRSLAVGLIALAFVVIVGRNALLPRVR